MNPLPNPIDEIVRKIHFANHDINEPELEGNFMHIPEGCNNVIKQGVSALQKIIDSEVLRGKAEEVRNHLVALNASPSEYNEILSMPLMARLTELDQQIEKLVKV